MPEAIRRVVVHQSNGLHVGIDNGAPDEVESPLLQVLRERITLLRFRGDIRAALSLTVDRPVPNETPNVGVEAPEFFLDRKKRTRIFHSAINLEPVPHQPGIEQQFFECAPE